MVPLSLLNFAKKAYENHDSAHDFNHAMRVWNRAQQIIKMEELQLSEAELTILPYVIIGHDFRDHKLLHTSLSENEIYNFYISEVGEIYAKVIVHCHNNCSWSKRNTSISHNEFDLLRKLLQDADWLDALGENGLNRCIQYSNAIGKPFPSNVVQHIKEKLLHIQDFLNFQASKKIVQIEHLNQPLLDFLTIYDN
jgi:uncharacterized protein